MDSENIHSFYGDAAVDLAGIRNGILIFIRDRTAMGEMDPGLRALNGLTVNARKFGLPRIESLASECERHLDQLITSEGAAADLSARRALDNLAGIEALLLTVPLKDGDFWTGIADTVDESFERFESGDAGGPAADDAAEPAAFEVDEETLEIFRSEASELLESIWENLRILAAEPQNRQALWKIRRAAHTFKGATGIVGMNDASRLAHRVEDLLDQLAELKVGVNAPVIDLLTASTSYLSAATAETGAGGNSKHISDIYADFDRVIAANTAAVSNGNHELNKCEENPANESVSASETADPERSVRAPIVRVSLDRLDELLKISTSLITNRSALAKRFTQFSHHFKDDRIGHPGLDELADMFENQFRLASEMQDKLLQIRMVRFGMLATRFNRAVQVTCSEEDKSAEVIIENQDLEIDTQLLDSLVEPLLHLLRNAVVHGIETPERRRLIGKREKGQIRIQIEGNENGIALSVSDDGCGLSAVKLKGKAVSSGAISRETADSLSNQEAFDLIFLRGVTTADKLSINAGRGVGMSIVKESVESRGGLITIDSESQRGTTFTIKIPTILATTLPEPAKPERVPGLQVLIVDDSASMRQMTSKVIEKAGWTAFTAKDGLDAIELLATDENRPDIILSDLEMPRLNGYELLETLKSDDNLSDIPVIMISSRSDDAHRQEAFELGAAEYLTKPYDEDALIEQINQVCVVNVRV